MHIPTVITSTYRPPFWLPGPHLQTLYPALLGPAPNVPFNRERWELGDGDFLDVDWIDAKKTDAPLLVLFHGLEGGSRSPYALAIMAKFQQLGWQGAVVHFRGCGGEANRLSRAYHAGDTEEIALIVKRVNHIHPSKKIYLAGISLGGNALLKWLGERAQDAQGLVSAAVAISAPLDLTAAGNVLDSGFNKAVYTRNFLFTLKRKALAKLDNFPHLFDRTAVARSATLREFDSLVTAPLHGFRDADDYWVRASSKPVLRNITVPTLLINARNDPFLPANALPTPEEVSTAVSLEYPSEGGHAGFLTGPFPGRLTWLPTRMAEFFNVRHRSS